MQIVWSPQSLRDLYAIRDYIAKDSEQYADLTIARIFSAVERLLPFPQSGRIVPEREDPEIREIVVVLRFGAGQCGLLLQSANLIS